MVSAPLVAIVRRRECSAGADKEGAVKHVMYTTVRHFNRVQEETVFCWNVSDAQKNYKSDGSKGVWLLGAVCVPHVRWR